MEDGSGGIVIGLLILAAGLMLYFLPTIVAESRGREGVVLLGIGNLLLGWTGIGWLVLLIVAFTGESKGARLQREQLMQALEQRNRSE